MVSFMAAVGVPLESIASIIGPKGIAVKTFRQLAMPLTQVIACSGSAGDYESVFFVAVEGHAQGPLNRDVRWVLPGEAAWAEPESNAHPVFEISFA
jgi:hypothetical protein